ncbi:hypothetical protein [Parapedobacter indicus]|uniref:Uncharacterized protein n=1 Tax=Parapedobacter indicus TaxID=1477437 RepID=A0A1I3V3Z1_9SPHI|nr:hypothetical protein [Parapedobacter indicus]PPK99006.1 hypothetical protein CLV26_11536 [Parapedobacter indicus]SFJ88851.1 hypothetical protein SAMN05444682_115141 [Parapedobacter indicus]
MTSDKIYDAVQWLYGNCDHRLQNVFIYNWESDFFCITKSHYSVEVEVKVSRSDFFADFKKPKHKLFENSRKTIYCRNDGTSKLGFQVKDPDSKYGWKWVYYESSNVTFINPQEFTPNKFYFACPENMVKPEEVPAYAGLIYVPDRFMSVPCYEAKKAPFLHKFRKNFTGVLMSKYYHRVLNAKRQLSFLTFEHEKDEPIRKELEKIIKILQ